MVFREETSALNLRRETQDKRTKTAAMYARKLAKIRARHASRSSFRAQSDVVGDEDLLFNRPGARGVPPPETKG